jgi:hypothetical protein
MKIFLGKFTHTLFTQFFPCKIENFFGDALKFRLEEKQHQQNGE